MKERSFATILVMAAIIITIDEIGKGGLSPKRYFGLIIAFLMLSFLKEYSPDLATALAWLVLVGILIQRGPTVLAQTRRLTSR